MTVMGKIQARSTPDEIAAGIKWERVKIEHGVLTEEFDRAHVHVFVMLVRDDAAWSVHACKDRDGNPGHVMVQGQSLSVEAARRDVTLALLGACEGAQFFFYAQQSASVMSRRDIVRVCDETARLIREAALNT